MTLSLIFSLSYIGPGLGGGIVTAVLGFLTSLILALFAIIWYPFKKLLERFKKKKDDEDFNN